MIPYDDLVTALASWRARQGLPTGQLPEAAAAKQAPAPAPAPAPAAKPARAATKPARAGTKPRPAAVIAEPAHVDPADVEAVALEEASFDSDFAMAFGGDDAGEATAIGSAPTPRAGSPRRGGR